jgi:hypothetical protein
MQTFDFSIEELVPAHPNLYLEHCVVMAVALMTKISTTPCEFILKHEGFTLPNMKEGEEIFVRISWNEVTAYKAKRIWQTEQSKPIIERAAVAFAALLIARFLPKAKMRVTREGQRADYWLPNLQLALEISGTTQSRLLANRHREKIKQMLSNPLQWNGYVITCCLSKKTRLIRWSYHQQKEGNNGRK